jgi:hypothetical protein
MEIDFSVGGVQAVFRRNHFTGKAVLTIGDDTQSLQNVLNPGTQFSLSNARKWQRQFNGHQIEIVKDRPMLLSPLRPHSYSVLVDHQVVAERTGY